MGYERSVHFYAMQYIEGSTLADVIRQLRQQEGLEQETRDNSHQTIGRMADTLTTATDRFSTLRSTRDDRTPAHPSVAGSAEVQRSEPDGEGSAAFPRRDRPAVESIFDALPSYVCRWPKHWTMPIRKALCIAT